MVGDDFTSGSAAADVHTSIMAQRHQFCTPHALFGGTVYPNRAEAQAACDARYPAKSAGPFARCFLKNLEAAADEPVIVAHRTADGVWHEGA